MRITTLYFLVPALLGTSLAGADDLQVAKTEAVSFATIDRNGDHRISKTEAGMYKQIIDRFAYIDTDGDGFISPEELNANLSARAVN